MLDKRYHYSHALILMTVGKAGNVVWDFAVIYLLFCEASASTPALKSNARCVALNTLFRIPGDRLMHGQLVAVARDSEHRISKNLADEIRVLAGLGVDGDAHQGTTVKHRSRVTADPTQPNLRQVHLIQAELFEELRNRGFIVDPAELGENITNRGIDLLGLPTETLLRVGDSVGLKLTGLRNPCAQIDRFRPGFMAAVLARGENGELIRKAGVMTIVQTGGVLRPGDPITIELPAPTYLPLEQV
jgi:hypothetical protein